MLQSREPRGSSNFTSDIEALEMSEIIVDSSSGMKIGLPEFYGQGLVILSDIDAYGNLSSPDLAESNRRLV